MEPVSNTNPPISTSERTLVIMAKAPRPGLVKTRLAQFLPPEAVTALYRCLLEDTIALAQSLRGVDLAIMCPAPDVDDLARVAGDGIRIAPQVGEGLVAGLTSVFEHFAASGQRSVIAFNSDSPHLPASVLEKAFESLATHDVVVGPTHDGGYYLVGAKAIHPDLFGGDGMGTASALEKLLERTRALRLSVFIADPFYDVDVASDLERLNAELRLFPARAPRTAAWLAEWKPATPQWKQAAGES